MTNFVNVIVFLLLAPIWLYAVGTGIISIAMMCLGRYTYVADEQLTVFWSFLALTRPLRVLSIARSDIKTAREFNAFGFTYRGSPLSNWFREHYVFLHLRKVWPLNFVNLGFWSNDPAYEWLMSIAEEGKG
jgi:hypothetical protein